MKIPQLAKIAVLALKAQNTHNRRQLRVKRKAIVRVVRDCYLFIDGFIELQVDFIHIIRLPLNSLNSDSLGSQLDLGMLQINCIDRQIEDILVFIRLTRSLRPRHFISPTLAELRNKPGKWGGGSQTFWMEVVWHFG